jgi:hypothetical protein
MQTLVSQLTTAFVDDAIELMKGLGKVIATSQPRRSSALPTPATSAAFWPAGGRRVTSARR